MFHFYRNFLKSLMIQVKVIQRRKHDMLWIEFGEPFKFWELNPILIIFDSTFKYLFYGNCPLTFHIWLTIGIIILVNIANKWCVPAKFCWTELKDSHKIRIFLPFKFQENHSCTTKILKSSSCRKQSVKVSSCWNKKGICLWKESRKTLKSELQL